MTKRRNGVELTAGLLPCLVGSLTFGVAAPAFAHHGAVTNPALYLTEELIELEGEIVGVFWRNPHVRLRLAVNDDAAETGVWELEMGPNPPLFRRLGISEDFITPGARVQVAGHISRRDSRSLGVLHLMLPSGREFVDGNRAARWEGQRVDVSYRPASTEDADPGRVDAARAAANGIFRVWGGVRHPLLSEYAPLMTERGRDLAAAYDPVTDNPELDCRQGMPTTMFDPVPMELIDEGERVLVRVQEYDVERVIHMGADDADAQARRSPLGHSVGHWDGDALVVATTRVDWPYFDPYSTPQSDQVSYSERFELSEDGDALIYSLTVTDPVIFTEPFTLQTRRPWTPGVEIEPYDCVPRWE